MLSATRRQEQNHLSTFCMEAGSLACTSGKVMVYDLGGADPRITGNQQLGGSSAARLWFICGKIWF
jgi:hypothetical protein